MGIKELKGTEAVEDVKKFIEKNSKCPTCHRSLKAYWFNRIPQKTKEEFNKWVKEEFCDDRGMGLHFLWYYYKGVLGKGSERAEAKADDALEQLNELKAAEPQEKKKTIKLVNGKEIKKR